MDLDYAVVVAAQGLKESSQGIRRQPVRFEVERFQGLQVEQEQVGALVGRVLDFSDYGMFWQLFMEVKTCTCYGLNA